MAIKFARGFRPDHMVITTAEQSITSDTVLTNDAEMLIPVSPNEEWVFFICWMINSGATPDFKFGWSVPSGTTIDFTLLGATAQNVGSESTAPVVATNGNDQMICLMGAITVGSTGGNVVPQWAQNTSDAGETKVLRGSHIMGFKVK